MVVRVVDLMRAFAAFTFMFWCVAGYEGMGRMWKTELGKL